MWLQFKRANKIHVLLFVTHFHVPIIVSFNPHTNPASTINASLDPFEASEVHYSPRDICNRLHWNQGRRRTLGKWVERGGGAYLTFYGKHFISNWFFSIKENNVKLTRDLKPLFVCFFVKKKLNYFACQFFKLPPSCVHQKLPPSFWSISKGLSSPL
jgi:hypothetical protein